MWVGNKRNSLVFQHEIVPNQDKVGPAVLLWRRCHTGTSRRFRKCAVPGGRVGRSPGKYLAKPGPRSRTPHPLSQTPHSAREYPTFLQLQTRVRSNLYVGQAADPVK